jgi:hypothetical protein
MGCNKAKYCSENCQRRHWESNHLKNCSQNVSSYEYVDLNRKNGGSKENTSSIENENSMPPQVTTTTKQEKSKTPSLNGSFEEKQKKSRKDSDDLIDSSALVSSVSCKLNEIENEETRLNNNELNQNNDVNNV